MVTKKYSAPKEGASLVTVISTGMTTPIVQIKYSTLVAPFYYPNSPSVPRFSVTCVFDPKLHNDFLQNLQKIEKAHKVETVIKNETEKNEGELYHTGKFLIKFQDRKKIPVYENDFEESQEGLPPELLELESELQKDEQVSIVFNIMRFTKKNTAQVEHGISLVPTAIHLYRREA